MDVGPGGGSAIADVLRSFGARRFTSSVGLLLPALLFSAPLQASADGLDATALVESYFEKMYGFDALEAYESRRGLARTTFSVARRWSDSEAAVLVDIGSPAAFSKWAFLIRAGGRRVDDMFVYYPTLRRVLRVSAPQVQRDIPFNVFPIGELRPFASGELEFESVGEAIVDERRCAVIDGRPLHSGLDFDRVRFTIDPESGFAFETRYFSRGRTIRSIHLSLSDLTHFGERLLPRVRRIRIPRTEGETELVLHNVLSDVPLPARLFSTRNLVVQRFPNF